MSTTLQISDPIIRDDIVQGSDEWLFERTASITSTDIASCSSADKKSSIERFIIHKNSQKPDLSDSLAIQKGKDCEGNIIKNFVIGFYTSSIPSFNLDTLKTGLIFERTVDFTTEEGNFTNRLLSSTDGAIYSTGGALYIIEAKTSAQNYHYDDETYILPSFIRQCAHHLLCSQAEGCFLVISTEDPADQKHVVHYLSKDDARIVSLQKCILELAVSTRCELVDGDVGDRPTAYWQLAKSRAEIKERFDQVAEECARLHYETEGIRKELQAKETELKGLPFCNSYNLYFKEYDREVKISSRNTMRFAIDAYVKQLQDELTKHNIAVPDKAKHVYKSSYVVVSVSKPTRFK